MSSSATASTDTEQTGPEDPVAEYLSEHPRMLGGLFTVLLLLTQVGNVAAGSDHTIAGP